MSRVPKAILGMVIAVVVGVVAYLIADLAFHWGYATLFLVLGFGGMLCCWGLGLLGLSEDED